MHPWRLLCLICIELEFLLGKLVGMSFNESTIKSNRGYSSTCSNNKISNSLVHKAFPPNEYNGLLCTLSPKVLMLRQSSSTLGIFQQYIPSLSLTALPLTWISVLLSGHGCLLCSMCYPYSLYCEASVKTVSILCTCKLE